MKLQVSSIVSALDGTRAYTIRFPGLQLVVTLLSEPCSGKSYWSLEVERVHPHPRYFETVCPGLVCNSQDLGLLHHAFLPGSKRIFDSHLADGWKLNDDLSLHGYTCFEDLTLILDISLHSTVLSTRMRDDLAESPADKSLLQGSNRAQLAQ